MPALDPIRADRLLAQAAAVVRDAAPGPAKRWARTVAISESRARRHRSGADQGNPVARVLRTFTLIAQSDVANAFPLLRESMAVLYLEQIRSAATESLRARLDELQREEHELEAAENAATCAAIAHADDVEVLDRLARAHARKADAHLEALSIVRELAERKRRGRE